MGLIHDPFHYIQGKNRLYKSSPKAPAAPDPAATAAAQTASNKDTAYWNAVLNNVNQVTPYGNLTYTQSGGGQKYDNDAYAKALSAWNSQPAPTTAPISGGIGSMKPSDYRNGLTSTSGQRGAMPTLDQFKTGTDAPPQFTSTITLSPEQQAIYDSQTKNETALSQLGGEQIGRIRDSVSTPYSYNGLPAAYSQDDATAAQGKFEDALYSRLNPQFANDEEALRTRLINQGIGQGSQAYNTEFERLNQAKNDARMQSVLQGANYSGTLQDQAMGRRNQAISEYDAQRNAPLNEYIGLTSGVQVQNPQFSSQNYQGAQAGDYQGAVNNAYQGALGQYNSKVASNNATQGALFGLGGSFLGSQAGSAALAGLFSDRRLKENIIRMGEENGFPIYAYNYIGMEPRYIGVMAQDVAEIMPEAIGEHDGFMTVNYNMIGLELRHG